MKLRSNLLTVLLGMAILIMFSGIAFCELKTLDDDELSEIKAKAGVGINLMKVDTEQDRSFFDEKDQSELSKFHQNNMKHDLFEP